MKNTTIVFGFVLGISGCSPTTVPTELVALSDDAECSVDEDCCAAHHQCSATYVAVNRSQSGDANVLANAPNVGQGCAKCASLQPLPVCVAGKCELIEFEVGSSVEFSLEETEEYVSCRNQGITTPESQSSAPVADCG